MAGEAKFMDMLSFKDGIWEDADIKSALEIVVKLRHYLEPKTVAQANKEGFTSNQQAVIGTVDEDLNRTAKGTVLFMPNGDWLPGEMSKTTPQDFEWGFMPLPAKDADSKSYVNTFIENVYLHSKGSHVDLAKEFLLFYYSDQGRRDRSQGKQGDYSHQTGFGERGGERRARGDERALQSVRRKRRGNGHVYIHGHRNGRDLERYPLQRPYDEDIQFCQRRQVGRGTRFFVGGGARKGERPQLRATIK